MKSNKSIEIYGAVTCGTFGDVDDLAEQIRHFTLDQLQEDLDCGFGSMTADWVAASSSESALLENLKEKILNRTDFDDHSDHELVRIKVSFDIEIIRKGG